MNVHRSLAVAALAGAATLYLFWGYSASRNLWPWLRLFSHAQRSLEPRYNPPQRFTFDEFGRLTGKVQSEAVDCLTQDARTAVFLIVGQSNAGNHGGQHTMSEYGPRIVNFFDGHCYLASSPLLGSTGTWGEYWTEVANQLVHSGRFEKIVLVPAAVSGSSIARWSASGDLNLMLRHTMDRVAATRFEITHVLWHQGETDAAIGMREEDYRSHFLSFIGSLRGMGVMAPVYVSVATKCLVAAPYSENSPIARAQATLASIEFGVRTGINSDQLLGEVDRYDGCHLSGLGTSKMALAWARLLGSRP
jgi:hypothetical protein